LTKAEVLVQKPMKVLAAGHQLILGSRRYYSNINLT